MRRGRPGGGDGVRYINAYSVFDMVTFLFGFIALVDTLVHPPRLFRGAGFEKWKWLLTGFLMFAAFLGVFYFVLYFAWPHRKMGAFMDRTEPVWRQAEDDVDADDRPGSNRMQCHPRCDMMGRAPCGDYRCAYGMITENGRNTWHSACNGTGRQRCRNYAMGLCERAP
jgi:hypothetical protein